MYDVFFLYMNGRRQADHVVPTKVKSVARLYTALCATNHCEPRNQEAEAGYFHLLTALRNNKINSNKMNDLLPVDLQSLALLHR